MISERPDLLGELSLSDIFRAEVESQAASMTEDLLALERDPAATHRLRELMRGAHSLKGAARIVNRDPAVRVAHAMEDCLVAAQRSDVGLSQGRIDDLLGGIDLLTQIANLPDDAVAKWESDHHDEIALFVKSLSSLNEEVVIPKGPAIENTVTREPRTTTRDLRIGVDNLNRLLGLAGESVVASHCLDAFATDLSRFKRMQDDLAYGLHGLRNSLGFSDLNERTRGQLLDLQKKVTVCQDFFSRHLGEFELFERRYYHLATRSYQEVLDCRMRPFSDGTRGFARMVRDAARRLGKKINLEIVGQTTPVDSDILKSLETSLGHLLRNAVDHGIETPADRRRIGKSETGTIRLETRHRAGMLLIEVTDDGHGIDAESLRRVVIEKGLTTDEVAVKLSEPELLEFVFLPGFTLKETVTEISGRGVGLDAVQTMIRHVGGTVRVTSQPAQGTKFQLQLPLTLSVLRTLLVEIAGEPYAFPVTRINRVLKLPRNRIESIEGREHFTYDHQQIGLVAARQVLGLSARSTRDGELPVVIIGEKNARYGVVVDKFLGERELVIRALDPRLGKVKDINGAALMADQSPVLIIDVEDLARSIENLASGGRLAHVSRNLGSKVGPIQKRVLVADDSLTVRELERKLIESKGYKVEVAVDGMDAWNAVRTGHYDLVVTDVDMPRLDGIELVTLIKKDVRLNATPTLIVSYKDREADRRRGLEAGADYYLTKGSFHDTTLLRAIQDLIGDAFEDRDC